MKRYENKARIGILVKYKVRRDCTDKIYERFDHNIRIKVRNDVEEKVRTNIIGNVFNSISSYVSTYYSY